MGIGLSAKERYLVCNYLVYMVSMCAKFQNIGVEIQEVFKLVQRDCMVNTIGQLSEQSNKNL